jgi:hypothetical protein
LLGAASLKGIFQSSGKRSGGVTVCETPAALLS